jgi:hypothetical protein
VIGQGGHRAQLRLQAGHGLAPPLVLLETLGDDELGALAERGEEGLQGLAFEGTLAPREVEHVGQQVLLSHPRHVSRPIPGGQRRSIIVGL